MDTLEVMLGQIGGDVESLHIMVLPMLIENAERLEELFNALDAMQTEVLPQVTETLGECGASSCHSRLEGIADLNRRQHASLHCFHHAVSLIQIVLRLPLLSWNDVERTWTLHPIGK